jgi:hypothetical protein
MNAGIIRLIPPPDRNRKPEDSSIMVFRSVARPDDLAMDHVDTVPREYVWSDCSEK